MLGTFAWRLAVGRVDHGVEPGAAAHQERATLAVGEACMGRVGLVLEDGEGATRGGLGLAAAGSRDLVGALRELVTREATGERDAEVAALAAFRRAEDDLVDARDGVEAAGVGQC